MGPTTNYTVGGLTVNYDTSVYGNLNVGIASTNKNIILNGDMYFGNPATTGVNFATKIKQLINNILSPMAPLVWYDNGLLPDKLCLKLDPNGNFLFGSVTVNNDLTVFRTTYLCNTVTIGNDIVSADTFMNGNLNVGTSSAPKNINLYGNIYRNGVLFNGNVSSNTIPTNGLSC